MKNKIIVGNHKGLVVEIEYELTDEGNFSASGGYWSNRRNDYEQCGQCLDEILFDFPNNDLVQRIHKVWKEWHLNDLTAGSPRQETAVKAYEASGKKYNYSEVSEYLKRNGLNPDTEYLHKGKPYKYGSAWLKRDLPADVIEEIKSWSITK